jgi:FkbM family methyltransferase
VPADRSAHQRPRRIPPTNWKSFARAIYQRIPAKQPLFSVVKNVWTPTFYRRLHFEGEFTVDIPHGRSFKMHHYNRYGIETELFWRGIAAGWEVASVAVWLKVCEQARVVLDIGAAEGMYALLTKATRPEATVIAFEPLPSNADQFEANVALNAYDIECVRSAVADYEGVAPFYYHHVGSTEGSLLAGRTQPNDPTINVPVRTLQSFIEERDLPPIDLMKIDVENAEDQVLRGLGDYLARFRPTMLIEVFTEETARKVESLVAPLGYEFYDINDDLRNGPYFIRRVERLRKATCLNYLLISPEQSAQLGDITTEKLSRADLQYGLLPKARPAKRCMPSCAA